MMVLRAAVVVGIAFALLVGMDRVAVCSVLSENGKFARIDYAPVGAASLEYVAAVRWPASTGTKSEPQLCLLWRGRTVQVDLVGGAAEWISTNPMPDRVAACMEQLEAGRPAAELAQDAAVLVPTPPGIAAPSRAFLWTDPSAVGTTRVLGLVAADGSGVLVSAPSGRITPFWLDGRLTAADRASAISHLSVLASSRKTARAAAGVRGCAVLTDDGKVVVSLGGAWVAARDLLRGSRLVSGGVEQHVRELATLHSIAGRNPDLVPGAISSETLLRALASFQEIDAASPAGPRQDPMLWFMLD